MANPRRPKFDTRITRLFGIEIPIVQGAMAWLSEPELVAAVSNQGGLGVLGASLYTPEEFEERVVRTKSLTDRPFAVNFPLVLGDFFPHLELSLRLGVKIVVVSAGSAKLMTTRIKDAGAICVHVVPNLKLAQSVERAGVDAMVLESFEAGGHVSTEGITAITNIPNVTKKVGLPVIAAGGLYDGRGLAAALALGADAIQMGTRFLATQENNAHQNYKELLVKAGEGDVPVYSMRHHPGRAMKSPVIDRILEMEATCTPNEEVRAFIGRGRARKAADGNLGEGMFYAGSGAGCISEVLSVEQVFDTILEEYRESVERLRRMTAF
jgi:enoyl-[acyl-carrier protein] reductase II